MNTSETIPFPWLFWQQDPSQPCCHTSLPIPQHTVPEYMRAICVPAQSQAAGGWFLCAHSRTPTPSSEKLQVVSHETPERRKAPLRGKMNHQNECREKWEDGAGIQIKLSCSIPSRKGRKICCHRATQHILWSLVPQGLSSALLQCHPSVKTLNSLQAPKWTPLPALGMFRDWDLGAHQGAQLSKYQTAQDGLFYFLLK